MIATGDVELQEAVDTLLAVLANDRPGPHTLRPMSDLMTRLGDPQHRYPVIHIAGTSGKTSTTCYLSAMLHRAGAKVGTAISPHLDVINERVQINGRPLSPAVYSRHLRELIDLVGAMADRPTRFELLTALAFRAFAEERVDYAVIEVGIGGLLDATNVITRQDKLCLICTIGFDHTEILGTSLPQIATAKAGIVHAGNHVIIQRQAEPAATLLRDLTADRGGHLEPPPDDLQVPGAPRYQIANLSLAWAGYRYLHRRDGLPELADAAQSLAVQQTPPGRYEVLRVGGHRVVLDGAHNPQKLRALREQLEHDGTTPDVALIGFSACPPHKLTAMINEVAAMTRFAIAVDTQPTGLFSSKAPVTVNAIAEAAAHHDLSVTAAPSVETAMRQLLTNSPGLIAVTGSLYLVASARQLLLAVPTWASPTAARTAKPTAETAAAADSR